MSRRLTAALKAWDRDRWLTSPASRVLDWAEEVNSALMHGLPGEGIYETLEDIQEASEWWVTLCRMRIDGLKEKHCLRVLSLPADLVAKAYHRERAQEFVDGCIRWRREIAALNDGRKTDENHVD